MPAGTVGQGGARMRVLVAGASVAGPVLAYWLTRHGFAVTVVERTAARRTGGHAVDLFTPALAISAKMGVLPRLEERATGTNRLTLHRAGARRPVRADLGRIFTAAGGQHVEIFRDDLSEIYRDATRDTVEYVLGDSVTGIGPHGEVRFATAPPRRFDLVVGADGAHSTVRRLVFGDEARFSTFTGAYLGVLTLPDTADPDPDRPDRELLIHAGVGRIAGRYGARHLGDPRVLFLFRGDRGLDPDRDPRRQRALLRGAFAGLHADVDRWLGALDHTPAFFFDAINQIRLDTWSSGRVTLVGDAGYGPGPALGGGTTLAVVGAYVLAGELARAGGDPARAFPAYERAMAEHVRAGRAAALSAARTLLPRSRLGVRALAEGVRLVAALPTAVGRTVLRSTTGSGRVYHAMTVDDYPSAVPDHSSG